MTFIERWLVYPIPPRDRSDWEADELDFEDVRFDSLDGTSLYGWLFEHPDPKQVMIYYHGNGEQVADNGELMDFLREQFQATVLIVDYRGYGYSHGKPHEAGVVADGIAAQRWLSKQTGWPTEAITLIGRSLGGGVAIAAAQECGAHALVLQSTFARLTDAAAVLFPWLPVRLLMVNRFDSLARIAKVHSPVLQSHGNADEVVPLKQGQKLFEASPAEKKDFYLIERGDHNTPQPLGYYDRWKAFMQELGPPRRG